MIFVTLSLGPLAGHRVQKVGAALAAQENIQEM